MEDNRLIVGCVLWCVIYDVPPLHCFTPWPADRERGLTEDNVAAIARVFAGHCKPIHMLGLGCVIAFNPTWPAAYRALGIELAKHH